MGEQAVLGRIIEAARLADMIAAIADGPRSIVVEGEAGIGKTVLWSAAVDAARSTASVSAAAGGVTVLEARAVEAERDLANVVLTDLLASVAAVALPTLPGPQAHALAAALLLDGGVADALTDRSADPRAVGTAVLGVLRHATLERPVLLAIDDVQWIDPASAAALEFALRRVAVLGLPVGVLSTRRVDSPDDRRPPAGDAVTRLDQVMGDKAAVLSLGPISLGVLHQLLRDRTGATLTRPQLIRLEEASRGNPMLAIEIGRELARLDRWPLPGEPLPVPADTRSLIAARLERLPRGGIEVLFVAAAMAGPTIAAIAAVVARPTGDVEAAIDQAVEAGILVLANGPTSSRERIRFVHPIMAAAALAAVQPDRRRALHARLAEAAISDEDRGRHVALAAPGPDEGDAVLLDLAARAARRRGAPGVAAAWADASASLTPPGDAEARCRRQLRAARWWTESGDVDRGRAIYRAVIETMPAGDQRAEALGALAQIVGWDDGPAALQPLAEAALSEAHDPELRARLLLRLASGTDHLGAPTRAAWADAAVRELRSMVERTPDPDLLACALLESAALRYAAGRADDEASVRAARALLASEPRVSVDADERAESMRAHALAWEWADDHDRLDEAIEGAMRDLVRVRERGLDRPLPIGETEVALLLLRIGRWEAAAGHAQAAMEAAELAGNPEGRRAAAGGLAAVAALRGQVVVADALLAQAAARGGDPHDWLGIRLQVIEGSVALMRGDHVRATTLLGRILDAQVALGNGETLMYRFAGDLVEAAVAAGDLDRARTTVAVLQASVTSRPRPWVRVMAARGRALLAAAQGDLVGASLAIAEAIEHGADLPMPFEQARTELVAGRIARRRKERRLAGLHLERAAHGFRTLGAAGWLAIAEAELGRLGRRAGGGDVLTETETQVATLAARGLTNREVGEAAFLTAKSVEGVLARVYLKLGISSRAELGAWLAGRASGRDSGIPPFRPSGGDD